MVVEKMVDNMTRESCILTVLGGDDHSKLIHNTGVGVYTNSNKTNPTYYRSPRG